MDARQVKVSRANCLSSEQTVHSLSVGQALVFILFQPSWGPYTSLARFSSVDILSETDLCGTRPSHFTDGWGGAVAKSRPKIARLLTNQLGSGSLVSGPSLLWGSGWWWHGAMTMGPVTITVTGPVVVGKWCWRWDRTFNMSANAWSWLCYYGWQWYYTVPTKKKTEPERKKNILHSWPWAVRRDFKIYLHKL